MNSICMTSYEEFVSDFKLHKWCENRVSKAQHPHCPQHTHTHTPLQYQSIAYKFYSVKNIFSENFDPLNFIHAVSILLEFFEYPKIIWKYKNIIYLGYAIIKKKSTSFS